jgi:hypothetical protein
MSMAIPRYFGGGGEFLLGSHAGDRRRACRYPVVFQDMALGWWQDALFVNVRARLVDLSTNGCLAEVARHHKLPTDQTVWVRSHGASHAAWTEGRIITVRKLFFGKCKVRITFRVPFEYETFKRLVYGPDHLREVTQSQAAEHEKDEFWKMNPGRNNPPDA